MMMVTAANSLMRCIFALILFSQIIVISADQDSAEEKGPSRNSSLKSDCHKEFMNKLKVVVNGSLQRNASWWRARSMTDSVYLEQLTIGQIKVFLAKVKQRLSRYYEECSACTQNGKGYPCCLRERANFVTKMLTDKRQMYDHICRVAGRFGTIPENCAPHARASNAGSLLAAMERCEAKCDGGSKQLAVCLVEPLGLKTATKKKNKQRTTKRPTTRIPITKIPFPDLPTTTETMSSTQA